MPEPTLTFKCLGHTKREDSLVVRYQLEVTDSRSGKTATVSVVPRQLASARSMKRILVDRYIFYRATGAEYDIMLLDIFDPQSAESQE